MGIGRGNEHTDNSEIHKKFWEKEGKPLLLSYKGEHMNSASLHYIKTKYQYKSQVGEHLPREWETRIQLLPLPGKIQTCISYRVRSTSWSQWCVSHV